MNNPLRQPEVWASARAYEPYIGRWSRLVAREFLSWLAVLPQSRWLDVGCGTGAMSQTILDRMGPAHVDGVDRSEAFVAFAQETIHDPRAQFRVGDAQALPVEAGAYDAAVSGLMLNFVAQPELAVKSMARAVKPG